MRLCMVSVFLSCVWLILKYYPLLFVSLQISCNVYGLLVCAEFLIWEHFHTKLLSRKAYCCIGLLEFTFTSQDNVKMSSRRKRAPPVRVDEEKQQQLCWNMHEDRRNEPLIFTDDEQPDPGPDPSSAQCIILDDGLTEEVAHRDKRRCSETVSISKSIDRQETADSFSPSSAKLNIVIFPCHFDNSWKAFLGEFALRLLSEQSLAENFSKRSFTLMSSESSSQFLVYVHPEGIDV